LENAQGQLEELLKGQESVFAQVWCHGQLMSQTSLFCSAIEQKANDGGWYIVRPSFAVDKCLLLYDRAINALFIQWLCAIR
jgi:hypothetical protein